MIIKSLIKNVAVFGGGYLLGKSHGIDQGTNNEQQRLEEEMCSLDVILWGIEHVLTNYFGSTIAVIDEIALKYNKDMDHARENLSKSLRVLDFSDNLLVSKYVNADLTRAGELHFLSHINKLQEKIATGVRNPLSIIPRMMLGCNGFVTKNHQNAWNNIFNFSDMGVKNGIPITAIFPNRALVFTTYNVVDRVFLPRNAKGKLYFPSILDGNSLGLHLLSDYLNAAIPSKNSIVDDLYDIHRRWCDEAEEAEKAQSISTSMFGAFSDVLDKPHLIFLLEMAEFTKKLENEDVKLEELIGWN